MSVAMFVTFVSPGTAIAFPSNCRSSWPSEPCRCSALTGVSGLGRGLSDPLVVRATQRTHGLPLDQQAMLVASDRESGDEFGYSVAVSSDTALVGTFSKAVGSKTNAGAVYVFKRSGTSWSHQAELTDPDPAADDSFGLSVAISGDTALIGAPGTTVSGQASGGAVYVFTRSGTSWSQQAELTAYDAATSDDFGQSVALSGDTAIIGAPGKIIGGQACGAAYVFGKTGTSWSQQAELSDPGATGADEFGFSVAISNETTLIGALGTTVDGEAQAGEAYVFDHSGTFWTLQAALIDPNAGDGSGIRFGASVALSGNTALVGAVQEFHGTQPGVGEAYVFTRSGTSWARQADLNASDAADFDTFGSSVALYGDTALVGAENKSDVTLGQVGAAYLFARSGTTWSQQCELTSSGAGGAGHFGSCAALFGDTALVGAFAATVDDQTNAGAAFVYQGSPPTVSPSGVSDGVWLKRAATITLSAAQPGGGSGVQSITYAIDGGASSTADAASTQVTIAAPSTHKDDGMHTLSYYATDNAGVSGVRKTLRVGIDTSPPQSLALGAQKRSCRHGAAIKLPYEIKDRIPGCGKARVVIAFYRIPRRGSAVYLAQRLLGSRLANRKYSYIFRCTLGKGYYLYVVKATDLAGNASQTSLRYGSTLFSRTCRQLKVE